METKTEKAEGEAKYKVDFPRDYGKIEVPFIVWALARINCQGKHE